VAVLVDFRPLGKLRGNKPVDVITTIGPVVDALAEDSVNLSRVRVVRDWVQYRSNFRDVVDISNVYDNLLTDEVLFPAVLDANADRLILEFARKGYEDLEMIQRFDKLITNPDCGLRHLPAHVARSKLSAMVEGTVAVRRTLPEPTVEQGA
jgi:methionine synthase II (cobalamin-independent)